VSAPVAARVVGVPAVATLLKAVRSLGWRGHIRGDGILIYGPISLCTRHGHLDHCGAVGMHASRRQLTGAQPATYVCHPDMVLPLQEIFGAYRRLSESLLPAVITPLTAGEQAVQLDSGGHPCKVRVRCLWWRQHLGRALEGGVVGEGPGACVAQRSQIGVV
jgi:hypothetical protein